MAGQVVLDRLNLVEEQQMAREELQLVLVEQSLLRLMGSIRLVLLVVVKELNLLLM